MQNKGKVFSRDRLLDGAWGSETYVIDRTVDVHVRSIRQKLGAQRNTIETVRGSGYRFVDG
jgi:DNA-binding response OmpR family regulator